MEQGKKLAVVWTSGDKEVAEKMVFMYTFNAKKFNWWDEINFIIWGPSSKLLSQDKDLQEYIAKMKEVGIKVYACKACADMYGVSADLEKIGAEVKYMGKPLTEYLQSDYKVITF
ncbi:DsrE family protein [Marinifilum sp. JC070]|uniref:DsrE family protein n=2 Tax=Marinifilum caeruleilacunae TaxID=2499076 RepID=A0ABX1WXN5_9BACT|nr:DsrE family protein [Marinifilum caeruleilacunae]